MKMKKLFSILAVCALLAACSSDDETPEIKGNKITSVTVQQTMKNGQTWQSVDKVSYDDQGRLKQVDYITFSYEDGKVIADCANTAINQRFIRRCEVTTPKGNAGTMKVEYHNLPDGYSSYTTTGTIAQNGNVVTLDLAHSFDDGSIYHEYLKWQMDNNGRLEFSSIDYDYGDGPTNSKTTPSYDPSGRMMNQDLTAMAFYVQSAELEDLVMMVAGYLPALKKDAPVSFTIDSYLNSELQSSETVNTAYSFDENGKCTGADLSLAGTLLQTLKFAY